MTYSDPAGLDVVDNDRKEAASRVELSLHKTYLYLSSLWYLQYPLKKQTQ